MAGCSVAATTLIHKELRHETQAACQPATVSRERRPAQGNGHVCPHGGLSVAFRLLDDPGDFAPPQEAVHEEPALWVRWAQAG